MRNRSVIISLLLLNVGFSYAQNTISGKITTDGGRPAQAVNIMLLHPKTGSVVSFGFTDDSGEFKIDFSSKADSIMLTARSLSHRDTSLVLPTKDQYIELMLSSRNVKIKEVSVFGRPISSKDDTTKYIVESFKRPADQSLADVMGRMPGFSVATDGKIAYMGQEIEKYYIEGLDLLGNRYALANKSLAYRDVAAVEILHNHQPIKMLRGITHNSGTAVNIRLKNKFTTTYRIDGDVGIPWPMFRFNITTMIFAPGNQVIASAQTDNTGENISFMHDGVKFNSSEIDNSSNRKTSLLGISSLAPSLLSNQQRYLFNHSNLLTYNHLIKTSADSEFKVNMSYFNDNTEEKASVITNFFLQNDTISLIETDRNLFGRNSLIANIEYGENKEKKFLKNKMKLQSYWDKDRETINNSVFQKAYTPHLSVADELDWNKLLGKHYVSFKVFGDYNHSPQNMSIKPGAMTGILNGGDSYAIATQRFDRDDLRGLISGAFTMNYRKWAVESKVSAQFNYSDISTSIETDNVTADVDSLINNMNWLEGELAIMEQFRYESPTFKVSLLVPLSIKYYSVRDKIHEAGQNTAKPMLLPSANLIWDMASFWSIKSRVSYDRKLEDAGQLTKSYILRNYRVINRGTGVIAEDKHIRSSAGIHFRNPVAGWMGNITAQYMFTQSNVIHSQNSLGGGVFQNEAVNKKNNKKFYDLSGELVRFIASMRWNISVGGQYMVRHSDYLLDNRLSWSTLNATRFNMLSDFGHWRHFQAKYNYVYSFMNQETSQAKRNYKEQQHQINLLYFPTTEHIVSLRSEYYWVKGTNNLSEAWFSDFSYMFKPGGRKLSYRLSLRNILNAHSLTTYSHSAVALTESNYELRPCQLILSLNWGL